MRPTLKTAARRLLPAVAALLLLAGAAAETRACSCMPDRPVCEAFGEASAVFVGRVVGAAERKTSKDYETGKQVVYDVGAIRFEVEEAFGGVRARRRVTIHSGTGGGDCGYWFRRGRRYLIYANEYEGKLYTNICTRTRPLEAADEDLAFLRDLPPRGTGARLYGVVARPPYTQPRPEEAKLEGLVGVKVVVEGPGGSRRELFTDAEGRYELTNLKPGAYKVSAELPPQYYRHVRGDDATTIADRGCAEVSFAAVPNGVVSGRVVSAEGEPVRKAEVALLRADAEGPLGLGDEAGKDYMDDAEGRFEIGQIPPGEYVLGVNLTAAPTSESPYPPTFYPGVTERAEASVIKLGLGEKAPDLLLRLPPPLGERGVSGVVVWPDGTPAAGAEVYLTASHRPGYNATGWGNQTDAEGRFTLRGFDGLTYFVQANAPRHPSKPYHESGMTHAEPPRVTLTADAYGLRLVLTSEGAVCEHYYERKE